MLENKCIHSCQPHVMLSANATIVNKINLLSSLIWAPGLHHGESRKHPRWGILTVDHLLKSQRKMREESWPVLRWKLTNEITPFASGSTKGWAVLLRPIWQHRTPKRSNITWNMKISEILGISSWQLEARDF